MMPLATSSQVFLQSQRQLRRKRNAKFKIEKINMALQSKATLETLLKSLGFDATVDEQTLDDGIFLDVKTEDSGRLIGRQGQTLSDLQYITNRLLFQKDQNSPKV